MHAPALDVGGPLVSCLMVTRGAAFPAQFAIECYRRQSYKDRELVIVCDRPNSEVSKLVAEIADPTIRYIEAAAATLGELRNVTIAQARGAFVCQWDDDDLYHRERIELQLAMLSDRGDVAATFLHRWLVWWPARRVIAVSGRRTWEGTMLARREAPSAYPAQPLGEDNVTVSRLCAIHRAALIDWPHGYCYIVHDRNSYGKAHFEEMIGRATQLWRAEHYDAALASMSRHFPLKDYAQGLARHKQAE